MSEITTIDEPFTLSPDDFTERLAELKVRRRMLTREIRAMTVILRAVPRPELECLHCGFRWTPYNPYARPKGCPRCGCWTWMNPPLPGERTPADPPAASWRTRKGTKRKPKLRVMTPREFKLPTRPIAPSPSPERTWTAPPPRIASLLPPPPSIQIPSLSMRFAQLRADESEPQPERVTSHLAIPQAEIEETIEEVIEPVDELTGEEIAQVMEERTEEEILKPAPLPAPPEPEPENRIPVFTEHELNALAEAEDVVWPTTKSDD